MLGKLLDKQREHMEKAKIKTKERNAKIEKARVSGIKKIDNKFNLMQQELEVSREENNKKIDIANDKILNTKIKEQIKPDKAPCCPKCSSEYIQAQKQGFRVGKAVAGVVVAGPIGAVAGGINKNKIQLTCLKCGNKFKIK